MQLETFNPDMFLELPLELQNHIITQKSNLIKTFSRVNQDYHQVFERPLYNLCDQPINKHEYYYITDFQPIRGKIYKKYLNKKISNLIVIDQKHLLNGNTSMMIEVLLDTQGVVIQEIPSALHEQKINFYEDVEYDLLSLYHLWLNRLSCMKMDADYAKKRIINILDNKEQMYYKNKNKKIDFAYKNFIVTLYCNLIMNKYIFNIIDESKITKLNDLNIDDIKNDIEYLFEEIRKQLK